MARQNQRLHRGHGANGVRREGVGAPLVRRERGEIDGAAGRQDARVGKRLVFRADAHLAEAAGEEDPGFVDLVAVGLALELDAGADFEAVVQNGRTTEVDFGVAEEAVGVALVAGLAFVVVGRPQGLRSTP